MSITLIVITIEGDFAHPKYLWAVPGLVMLHLKNSDNLAQRYFQPGTAFNRMLQEAPYFARCSDNKTASRVRPREYALRYPYMQVNRSGFVSWLIFDLDHNNPYIWEDVGLPAPNLIVQNRASGNSHLYYAITPVCTTENARDKPIAYMKAIYTAFAARLNADTEFHSGPVAKTPGHRWWLTSELHNRVHDLAELADFVELEAASRWGKVVNVDHLSHSRHEILFELVRHYAYAIVGRERQDGNFITFTQLVEAFAHNRNSFTRLGFDANLPHSSIRATVKSIARWTWTHYTGTSRCHRGAMRLDGDLPLLERQRLAADRTHDLRRKATMSKIRVACRVLHARGEALTQLAISKIAKLSRQTVAAYKQVIEEPIAPVVAVLAPASPSQHDVKYGAHQITGGGAFVPTVTAMVLKGDETYDDGGGGVVV